MQKQPFRPTILPTAVVPIWTHEAYTFDRTTGQKSVIIQGGEKEIRKFVQANKVPGRWLYMRPIEVPEAPKEKPMESVKDVIARMFSIVEKQHRAIVTVNLCPQSFLDLAAELAGDGVTLADGAPDFECFGATFVKDSTLEWGEVVIIDSVGAKHELSFDMV